MSREELVHLLRNLEDVEPEEGHATADGLLLAYIDDEEVTAAFMALTRWYA